MDWTCKAGVRLTSDDKLCPDGTFQYLLPGRYAGLGYTEGSAVEISTGNHYNGSGETAFGGAKQWPVVKLVFSLPTDSSLSAQLVDHLKQAVESFMVQHPELAI